MNNWNLVFNLVRNILNISKILNWIDIWQHLRSISIFMKYIFFSFIRIKSWILHTKRWFMDITYSCSEEEEGQRTRLLDLSPAKLYIFSGQCSFEIRWHPFFFFFLCFSHEFGAYLIFNILLPLNFFNFIHISEYALNWYIYWLQWKFLF